MNMKIMLARTCYLINAIYFLIIGLLFTFSTQLLPFHIDVIQTSWNELSLSFQTLFLGMMRTEGAGFLTAAAALFILFAIPYRRKEKWAAFAMSAIGTIEHLPTLIANFHVAQTTSASPPWPIALTGIALLMLGLLLTLKE